MESAVRSHALPIRTNGSERFAFVTIKSRGQSEPGVRERAGLLVVRVAFPESTCAHIIESDKFISKTRRALDELLYTLSRVHARRKLKLAKDAHLVYPS